MKNLIDFLIRVLAFFMPKRFRGLLTYETVSYLFFGVLTTIIGLGTYALFIYGMGMSAAVASIISNMLAIIFAFITNKIYVFESPSWELRVLLSEIVKFGASRALTSAIEGLALWLLVDNLGFDAIIMRLLTMAVIQVIGNYVLSKWIVFTDRGVE